MHALNLQLKAKLSFALGQYAIGSTWISQHLETLVSEKVRSWLSLPPFASAHHLPLPASKLGHDLVLPSLLYEQSQAGTRLTLAQSKDPNIRTLFEIDRNPRIDSLLQLDQPRSATQKYIKKKQHEAQIIKQNLLTDQNLTILQLKASLSGKELKSWSEHIEQLTPSIANFARRALIRCLPTQANLQKWNKAASDACPNCGHRETDRHVLNNCNVAAVQNRYTWRHDAVLKQLIAVVQPRLSSTQKLYVDIAGYRNPSELFDSSRPDIAVLSDDTVHVLELTCCHELNIEKSHEYKQSKYQNLMLSKDINLKLSVDL